MDLIGHDVNFAVTRSVWNACFHDPRYTPSVLQQELVAAGFLGRKSGRGFFQYANNTAKPDVVALPSRPRPAAVRVCGDLGTAVALASRLSSANVIVERAPRNPALPDGSISVGGGWLALTDGRTATNRAAELGMRDLVLFDLALDYATCTRLAVSRSDTCSDSVWDAAVGTLQAAGIAVSPFDDVAGLAVMRTVAMLANEAADAVMQKIATAQRCRRRHAEGGQLPARPARLG
jgi:3-hydroxybutyryl-CoA dehydrogenase